MYPELEELADLAEERYLTQQEIETFKQHAASLSQRLELYETLRDRELEIFQPIANCLETTFPEEDQAVLEQALIHWLSVLRYCAMAMLANNPEFLRSQLSTWFQGLSQTRNRQAIESELYQSLQNQLKELLSDTAHQLIQPLLDFAEDILLKNPPDLSDSETASRDDQAATKLQV